MIIKNNSLNFQNRKLLKMTKRQLEPLKQHTMREKRATLRYKE